jgi:hypothetical protein
MVEACIWLWWRMRVGAMLGAIFATADSGTIRPWSLRTRMLSRAPGLRSSAEPEVRITRYWLMSE